MSVHQYVSVILLPLDEVSEVRPQLAVVDLVHELIVVVELYHAATASECAAQLVESVLVVHVLAHVAVFGEDEAVGHQRVDRTERRVGNVDVVHLHVAVCDPCLAVVRVGTNLLPIGILTPCSVGNLVPER